MDTDTIFYSLGSNAYVNLTNACPCDCDFCIRRNGDTVGDSGSLRLSKEPGPDEVKAAFDAFDLTGKTSVVFCGYGEPTCRLDVMLKTAGYIKAKRPDLPIRLNTNGLSDLINKKRTAPLMEGLIDSVSVSLNASCAEKYVNIVHPAFGLMSFDAMLEFTRDAKKHVPDVRMTVVDVIGEEEIRACRRLCAENGIELRVREFIG